MRGSSGVSVVRPSTSSPGDPSGCINFVEAVYCACGRISLGRNLLHNQGGAQSLPLDRKLKCGSVSLSVTLVNHTYVRI